MHILYHFYLKNNSYKHFIRFFTNKLNFWYNFSYTMTQKSPLSFQKKDTDQKGRHLYTQYFRDLFAS